MFVHSKYAQADLEFIIMTYFSEKKKKKIYYVHTYFIFKYTYVFLYTKYFTFAHNTYASNYFINLSNENKLTL